MREAVVICWLVSELEKSHVKSSVSHCADCRREVWLSDDTIATIRREMGSMDEVKVSCRYCGKNSIQTGEIQRPSPEQREATRKARGAELTEDQIDAILYRLKHGLD